MLSAAVSIVLLRCLVLSRLLAPGSARIRVTQQRTSTLSKGALSRRFWPDVSRRLRRQLAAIHAKPSRAGSALHSPLRSQHLWMSTQDPADEPAHPGDIGLEPGYEASSDPWYDLMGPETEPGPHDRSSSKRPRKNTEKKQSEIGDLNVPRKRRGAAETARYRTDDRTDYLSEIGKLPLLTPEEEKALSASVQRQLVWEDARAELTDALGRPCTDAELAAQLDLAGGESEYRSEMERMSSDKARFVESNLGLVIWVAKRYALGVSFRDLVQAGSVGLVEAVERFDGTRGSRFSSYATWWMQKRIQTEKMNLLNQIRLPMNMFRDVQKLRQARYDLKLRFGRPATYEELAQTMSTDVDQLRKIDRAAQLSTISIDSPFSRKMGDDGSSITLQLSDDGAQPEDNLDTELLWADFERLLDSTLTDREAYVVRMRLGIIDGIPRTYTEIGDKLQVSGEYARKLQVRASEKLRSATDAMDLADYLSSGLRRTME